MKTTLLLLFTVLIQISFAQNSINVSQIQSEKITVKNPVIISNILGSDEAGNIYYLHVNMSPVAKKGYFIDKYDKSMKLIATKELDYNQHSLNKVLVHIHSFETNGNIYFLAVDESGGHSTTSVVELNKNTLTFSDPIKVIATANKSNYSQEVTHHLIISPDSSKFCLVYFTDKVNVVGVKTYASVFNKKFEVEWESDIEFPFSANKCRAENYSVDNSGTLNFLLATSEKPNLNQPMQNIDCSALTWKIGHVKKNAIRFTDVKLTGGEISFPRIYNTKNDLGITGFYSSGKGENVKGVFSMQFDNITYEVKQQTTKPVPDGFTVNKTSFKEDDNATTMDGWSFSFGAINPLENGAVIWTAEQVFTTVSGSTQNNYSEELASRLGLICVKINADNSIAYLTKIPKRQSYYAGFSSCAPYAGVIDNHLYVAYKDNPLNINVYDPPKIKAYVVKNALAKQSYPDLVISKIEDDGSYKKTELVSEDVSTTYFNAGSGHFLGNHIILPAANTSKHSVSKLVPFSKGKSESTDDYVYWLDKITLSNNSK